MVEIVQGQRAWQTLSVIYRLMNGHTLFPFLDQELHIVSLHPPGLGEGQMGLFKGYGWECTFWFSDCWFRFLFLFLLGSFRILLISFGRFLFWWSGFTVYTVGYKLMSISKERGRVRIPSSDFRFLLFGGMTAISPFGTLLPLLVTLSFSFPAFLPVDSFAFPHDV